MGIVMNVQDAAVKAQLAIGLSNQQPALPADSLLGLWQQAVADSAERPAFTCLGQTLSYAEVDQLAERIAGYFYTHLKLEAGDRLAVQLPNLLQYPIVVVAAWKLGLVIVNTNPMYTHRELVHQFNDSGAKAVVVLDQFYDTLQAALPETGVKHVVVTRAIDLLPQPKKTLLTAVTKLLGKRPGLPAQGIVGFTDMLAGQSTYPRHTTRIRGHLCSAVHRRHHRCIQRGDADSGLADEQRGANHGNGQCRWPLGKIFHHCVTAAALSYLCLDAQYGSDASHSWAQCINSRSAQYIDVCRCHKIPKV